MTATIARLPRAKRLHKPKVTKADLDRVGDFLRAMGARIGAVDVSPEKVRIITTDGTNLTLPADDEETLNRELAEHRAKRGYGSS